MLNDLFELHNGNNRFNYIQYYIDIIILKNKLIDK